MLDKSLIYCINSCFECSIFEFVLVASKQVDQTDSQRQALLTSRGSVRNLHTEKQSQQNYHTESINSPVGTTLTSSVD
jgi:hypothetical protein